MEIAYIAHPIGGDVMGNLIMICDIVESINRNELNTVPFAPYFSDVLSMDDDKPEDRARGFKNNLHLLNHCDEIRLYGNRISKGMWVEIKKAREIGIIIKAMTEETKKELISKEPICKKL